MDPETEVFT